MTLKDDPTISPRPDYERPNWKGTAPEVFDRWQLWCYRAKAVRVIDGDTFIALIDNGFASRHEARIRIADLWAPEMNQEGGKQARDRLETMIMLTSFSDPWPLRIVTHQKDRVITEVTSFERWVADVYVVDGSGELRSLREVVDF